MSEKDDTIGKSPAARGLLFISVDWQELCILRAERTGLNMRLFKIWEIRREVRIFIFFKSSGAPLRPIRHGQSANELKWKLVKYGQSLRLSVIKSECVSEWR